MQLRPCLVLGIIGMTSFFHPLHYGPISFYTSHTPSCGGESPNDVCREGESQLDNASVTPHKSGYRNITKIYFITYSLHVQHMSLIHLPDWSSSH